MILPIYRSHAAVVQQVEIPGGGEIGDVPAQWHICRFVPIPHDAKSSTGRWVREVEGCMRPAVWVKTPPLCRMTEREGNPRLQTPYDDYGIDATSVYVLATSGERGFSLTTQPIASVEPQPVVESSTFADPEPEIREEVSIVVEVVSSFEEDGEKSFISRSAADVIDSTWSADEVRTWPTIADAEAWLESVELGVDRPVPVGTGWLRARVTSIDLQTLRVQPKPEWLRGIRFSYRFRPGTSGVKGRPSESIPVFPSCVVPAKRVAQASFAFAD